MDNEKTSGATIELDDSLSSNGNVGELHFPIENFETLREKSKKRNSKFLNG